jgi:hypothetical protein
MKRVIAISVLMLGAVIVFAQTEVPVGKSTTQEALVRMAKESVEAQKAKDDLLAKARTALETKDKPLVDQIKVKAKPTQDKIDAYVKVWQAKIDADTKDLRAAVDKNNKEAEAEYQKQVAPFDAKILSPQTLKTLEDIVKKEQLLPDDATFDPVKQVWTIPAKTASK